VGFVIPFLCDHPVVRFLLPYFERHSREGFEISCYFDKGDISGAPDSFRRVLSPPILLKSTAGLDDAQAAERIRADGIDILVDVAMHTEDNRLLVFARKPAPVQMTWLAYASTTGLDTIDYRLTDPYLDPPGLDPSIYTEKSLYLESFWCYWPPPEAPEVGPLPMSGAGRMTFGCLNNYAKVSRMTLNLWGRILGAVPGSRLILYCPEGAGRERAVSHLGGAGVGADRIGFVGPMKPADYFATYNAIDIALDPYPYGGGTTTCDALWMGVPVVSLTGKTAVSRAGASILSNAGVPQLVATTPEEYVAKAVALAGDRGELVRLRSSLREMVRTSRLGDAGRFTQVFEGVLRQAWIAYCQSAG